jgi:hypothetical protein
MLAVPPQAGATGMHAEATAGRGGERTMPAGAPTIPGHVDSGSAPSTSGAHAGSRGRGRSEERTFWSESD